MPQPQYPELARRRGQEGTVNVRCQVDAAGRVQSVELAKSSGFRLLDEAALKTVAKWKFRPGTRDGAPVAGTVIVPVRFQLR
ncbi:MAG: energy transducer TonB [Desulfovibrio sp.]|nr:energy transducer TonB [Desulfovibrio sp.]